MRQSVAISLLSLVLAVPAFPQKKRVAVLDFDYSTVYSGVQAIFGTNQDVGRGVQDLLVEKLVKDGTYSVIERKAMEKILAEQNFSNSDRADSNTAAKLGRLLGVDAIILGSVVQFGRDDKNVKVGGTAIGDRLGRFGVGGVGRSSSKAVVALTARMINVNTGEIFVVANGKGESARSGTSLLGAGGGGGNYGAGGVDMKSSNFANTILGEAVNQAVTSLSAELNSGAARIPTVKANIDALVADVSGKTLIINQGSRAGVKVGDKLMVSRVGREIRDPATGKVLRRTGENLGELTITSVDDASAEGTFAGTGAVKVGDSVKNQ